MNKAPSKHKRNSPIELQKPNPIYPQLKKYPPAAVCFTAPFHTPLQQPKQKK
jgi:hypothetical protein